MKKIFNKQLELLAEFFAAPVLPPVGKLSKIEKWLEAWYDVTRRNDVGGHAWKSRWEPE